MRHTDVGSTKRGCERLAKEAFEQPASQGGPNSTKLLRRRTANSQRVYARRQMQANHALAAYLFINTGYEKLRP
jgi:hypothetical protein